MFDWNFDITEHFRYKNYSVGSLLLVNRSAKNQVFKNILKPAQIWKDSYYEPISYQGVCMLITG